MNIQNGYTQVNLGLKIGIGDGQIASKNLRKNLNYQNQFDSNIQQWDAKNYLGVFYGFGGFIEFKLNENFSLVSEITFNHLNSRIDINYRRSDVNNNGNGEVIKIESIAKIRTSFLSVPFMFRYNFSGSYILGGVRVNIMGNAKIISEEVKTRLPYSSGTQLESVTEERLIKGSLDKKKLFGLNLILGMGKILQVNDKSLMIDIRYNLPLTRTELYSTNSALSQYSFENDRVFCQQGKSDAEKVAPAYKLKDFKMGLMEISIAYLLFQKLH